VLRNLELHARNDDDNNSILFNWAKEEILYTAKTVHVQQLIPFWVLAF